MELSKIQHEALEIILDVMENGKDSDRVAAAAAVLDLAIKSSGGNTWLDLSDQKSALFSSIALAIALL